MSIKAMKQVIELYDKHCYNNDYGGIEFNKKHGYKFIEAIEALRTAIQQAESEPVAWRYQPEDGLKFPGFTQYEAVAVARGKPGTVVPLYTHPDPRVPGKRTVDPGGVVESADTGYIAGGNDCREAMIAANAQKG